MKQLKASSVFTFGLGLCVLPHVALAAPSAASQGVANANQFAPVAGERLSAALRRAGFVEGLQPISQLDLNTLQLLRAGLLPGQLLQRTQLITELRLAGLTVWADRIQAMPVTGRLALQSHDADYLVLRPQLDPVLQADDRVKAGGRSPWVKVLHEQGTCSVPYEVGQEAAVYLRACLPGKAWYQLGGIPSKAWVVQPTGELQQASTGIWNASKQAKPMPGAWIIAPQDGTGLGKSQYAGVALRVAQFVATQGAYYPDGLPISGRGDDSVSVTKIKTAEPARDLPVSSNDFGFVGLMQTPTARMREAGSAAITASRVYPYNRYNFVFQPFNWFEAGFRYNNIQNRQFSSRQDFLDKNIDFKVKLFDEGRYLPAVAAGLQDIGGTSLFASEYLVASKRFGNFDTSLGLGWGYLGGAQDFSNPLGVVGEQFKNRPVVDFGVGGKLSASTYFRGRVGVFGGVQWHTPWEDLTLKLEYDGNDYQSEPLSNPQAQDSRWNYGMVFRVADSVNFHLGVERGNQMAVAVSLFENLSTFNTPKILDPKPIEVSAGPRPKAVDWDKTIGAFKNQTSWDVTEVDQRGSEVRLNVRNGKAAYYNETLEKASEVLHRDMPESVRWFGIRYENNGVDVAEHVVDRDQFVRRRTEYTQPREGLEGTQFNKVEDGQSHPEQAAAASNGYDYKTVHIKPIERYINNLGVAYQQVIGGADGYLYQFTLANDMRLNLTESTWLEGRLAFRLIDNFDNFKEVGSSALPQVRTNQKEYAVTSDFTIPNLSLKHMGSFADGHYYAAYGGLMERMFGGVGAEYLYRPFGSPIALGLDINRVRQRAFEQDFDFQKYKVTTGHATAYVDTGIQDVLLTLSAGQYLAGDRGVTVDLSRQFSNGVSMGAFVTRTNVPAEVFGEGSFDKGIYVNIPLNAFFIKSIPGEGSFLWRPITRDGGAKLSRGMGLYKETELRDVGMLKKRPGGDFE